ncbi:hypothetical protein [Bradyrhizobium canariense]|nr:hypothetical protein [Bradyrhizobium canariense]
MSGSAAPTMMEVAGAPVIAGRECGTCTLCCKVYHVPEIGKVAGKWCQHCTPGTGCAIHETSPAQCRDFNCLWRTEATLTPAWKPERSKMVLSIYPLNGFMYVQVDPGAPSAWRKQPYYDQLHRWAEANLSKGHHVIVFVGDIATLIMPGQDVPLGKMKPTDGFAVRQTFGPGGMTYEVTRSDRAAP